MATPKGNKHAVGNKGGRPSKYKPEYAKLAAHYCTLGATDAQLAEYFEVSEQTINSWKGKYPRFLESTVGSKRLADSKVERSLYQRACGYTHKEEKVFCSGGEIVTYVTEKHYPPETTAAVFWLKNRKPAEWRDLRNVEINVMTDEERVNRIDALLQSVLDREVAELTKH